MFVSGIPLSVFISPLLVLVALVGAYVADIFVTISPDVWASLREMVFILPNTWRAIRSPSIDVPWQTLSIMLVIPGTVFIVCVWLFIRILFRRVGVGSVLREIGPRLPLADDRRVVNLIEEISVAAGVQPPRVLVVDSDAANIAAIGLHIDDATVIVSSGLASRLTRDESQAIVAHVIGSVGNGDLQIAAQILSALQTWGFVSLLLDTPFGPRSRRTIRIVLRNAWNTARGRPDVLEGELALELLLAGTEQSQDLMDRCDEIVGPDNRTHPLVDLFVTLPLLVTMGIAAIAARLAVWMFTLLGAGPWIAALWRSRRRLADATAVELTRYPDAVASALRTLSTLNVRVPGAESVNFLFPVWDKDVDKDAQRTDIASLLLGMHLPFDKRLATVERLGAMRDASGESDRKSKFSIDAIRSELKAFGQLLMWLAIAIGILVLLMTVNFVALGFAMLAVWWILQLLLVKVPAWIRSAF